ncbi:mechanosensitive ion channel family protein [Flavobacterium cheniae]|jgi:small-conductance mechanosensitive channel|uniref:Mechanosensitive ion channel-like protein n=1 Tax=Flavobacterium cheniae TaxID=295428 RepID=A0A562KSK1_9FLAO|nr:mechanosensitive ion channel family protein [Flavobacterium cheniae]TDR25477.1 mechanosensitive ion channel-like protein [Flavobacterium cheniae]TWH98337.1 mechanosensitive ion channel-like protein [Flavobacterium cheniae]
MFELINNPYLDQEIATIVVLFLYFILRVSSKKLVRKYATLNEVLEHRSNLVIKYIYLLLGILAFISIVIIWGVKKDQIFLFISSVFAVAGVASFAQWSILSNITAGIILFFSYPFKIGDKIRIQDKENPVEGEIHDIKAFYVILKAANGEIITYPNNLLMQKGVSVLKDTTEEKEFFD